MQTARATDSHTHQTQRGQQNDEKMQQMNTTKRNEKKSEIMCERFNEKLDSPVQCTLFIYYYYYYFTFYLWLCWWVGFFPVRERANKRTKQKEMEKKETKKKRTQNEEHRRVRFRLWSLAFAQHIPTARNMRPPKAMKKTKKKWRSRSSFMWSSRGSKDTTERASGRWKWCWKIFIYIKCTFVSTNVWARAHRTLTCSLRTRREIRPQRRCRNEIKWNT